jgi:hypothetical protein
MDHRDSIEPVNLFILKEVEDAVLLVTRTGKGFDS